MVLYRLVTFSAKHVLSLIKASSKLSTHPCVLQRHTVSTFGHYDIVKPGKVSPMLKVPDHIDAPEYYKTGESPPTKEEIEIKTAEEIEKIRASSQLARRILNYVGLKIKVGMTTDEIDKIVHNMAIENGAFPSPLNYNGFPKSVCTSVNNVACHGIPDDRPLHDGDIINVDVTVYLNGYHGDCSSMFLVGNVDHEGTTLVNVTLKALESAIAICRPGEYIRSIGYVIEEVASLNKLSIVPVFTGHGIGAHFHEPPDIYHCYTEDERKMKPGMVFTIEPVFSQGSEEVYFADDDWTALTNDNGRAAQWEHTILITKDGHEVLTR